MGIEKDIQQDSFRNDYQKGIINLVFTFNWVRDQMQGQLADHLLTMQQYNILRILRGAKHPLSTLQIRERMLDKMSDTSRIVDRLIVKELVKKTTCKRDKRLVDVVITDKGLNLLKGLDGYSEQMDKVLGNLTEKEAEQLNTLLDKIREKADPFTA
ncbi:MAG: MarR family transcriptional regulator [Chitinophagaceae bacterium]